MNQQRWNTKKVRANLETLVAQCEVTLDTAIALGHQQAEAYARKALREANDARGSFDDGQFQYIPQAFAAASECRVIARSFL
jgi:hypothetical protein